MVLSLGLSSLGIGPKALSGQLLPRQKQDKQNKHGVIWRSFYIVFLIVCFVVYSASDLIPKDSRENNLTNFLLL